MAEITEQEISILLKAKYEAEGVLKKGEKQLSDLADTARLAATQLSSLFNKEQIRKAQQLAGVFRTYNKSLKMDTGKGLDGVLKASTVEELGQAFAKLTSAETSSLTSLFEEPEKRLSVLDKTFEHFTQRAKRSLHSLKRFLDRIGNIVMYRLIRQGLSLMVGQIQEGTKSVYIFTRAFKSIDQNHIADTLDRYATAFDRIRGNLGSAWATTLSNLADTLVPFLDKISEAIEKVTAFSSAIDGNSEYWAVAEKNVKRYYSTVANGLQDIKVINSGTRFEKKLIPDDVKDFAESVKNNLGGISQVGSSLTTGIGLTLLATGHVVAGVGLLAAGYKLASTDRDVEGLTQSTQNSILSTISKIQGYVASAELAIGTVLLLSGKIAPGAFLIERSLSNTISSASGQIDPAGDVGEALQKIKTTADNFKLPIGILLACLGNPYGYAILAGLVVDKTTYAITHWEEIETALSELGKIFNNWWNETFIKGIVDSWNEFWSDPFKAVKEDLRKPITFFEDTKAVENGTATSEQLFRHNDRFKKTLELGDLINSFTEGGLIEGLKHLFSTQFPTFFADGGFPSAGSLFLAGEVPGQTELLGTINGRTGVAGGAEITGIRQAIYEVGAELLVGIQQNRAIVNIEGDSDQIFRVVRDKSAEYTRKTGQFAF